MTLDEEIRDLERQLKTDPAAGAKIDLLLARAGRTPRRVWAVCAYGGEYSDRWEATYEPVHLTKEGALAHMKEIAEKQAWRGWRIDPNDPERYVYSQFSEGEMCLMTYEVVL